MSTRLWSALLVSLPIVVSATSTSAELTDGSYTLSYNIYGTDVSYDSGTKQITNVDKSTYLVRQEHIDRQFETQTGNGTGSMHYVESILITAGSRPQVQLSADVSYEINGANGFDMQARMLYFFDVDVNPDYGWIPPEYQKQAPVKAVAGAHLSSVGSHTIPPDPQIIPYTPTASAELLVNGGSLLNIRLDAPPNSYESDEETGTYWLDLGPVHSASLWGRMSCGSVAGTGSHRVEVVIDPELQIDPLALITIGSEVYKATDLYTLSFSDGFVAAVPEPSTLVLSAIGLTGIAAATWRRRRRRSAKENLGNASV